MVLATAQIREHIGRRHRIGAPEAAVETGAGDLEAPEAEVRKVHIERRLGMAGEVAALQALAQVARADAFGAAGHRKSRMGERIALARDRKSTRLNSSP